MYTVILCALVGLAVGCYNGREKDYPPGTLFGGFLGTIFGILVGFIVASLIGTFTPKIKDISGPFNLVSLKNSQGVSGAFVLGTGGIQSQTTYHVMVRTADGVMTPYTVTSDANVQFKEDPELQNVGYWTITGMKLDPQSSLFPWALYNFSPTQAVNEFRLPVGSVVVQFSAN